MKKIVAVALVAFMLLQAIAVVASTAVSQANTELFDKTIECSGIATGQTYVSTGTAQSFGVRINTHNGILTGIEVPKTATWDKVVDGVAKIWAWDTDYAKTVAAEPLMIQTYEDVLNSDHNAPFDVSSLNLEPGEYYVEYRCTANPNGGGWTPWEEKNVINREYAVEFYKCGVLAETGFPVNLKFLSDGSVTEYNPPAEEPDDDAYAVGSEKVAGSVEIGGALVGSMDLTPVDVIASQFSTTADMKSLSVSVPSFGNNTGRITLSLYKFYRNYKYTLKEIPLAQYTFENFADNGYLTFLFEDEAIPAGEYMLVLNEAEDETPTIGGGRAPGIGIWYGEAHESQRFYRNGQIDADASMILNIEYSVSTSLSYGILSEPEDVPLTYDELSPKMDSVLDGTDRDAVSAFRNYTQVTPGYTDGYIRLQTDGATTDPRTYVYFSGGNISVASTPVMLVKLRLSEGAPLDYQFFFQSTEMADISVAASVYGQYEATTDWQYALVNFGTNPEIRGTMKLLRWDMFQGTDAQYYLDVAYISFFQSEEAAKAFMGKDNFEDYIRDDPSNDKVDATEGVEIMDPAYTQKPTFEENGQRSYTETKYTYTLDATKTPSEYAEGAQFGFTGRSYASTDDGVLKMTDRDGSFTVFTKKVLGDKYALTNGVLTFDLELNGGTVTVGTRLVVRSDSADVSGLHFGLSRDGVVHVAETSSGCSVDIATGKLLSGKHAYILSDTENKIELYADDTLLCYVEYNSQGMSFTVYDAKGGAQGTFASQTLPAAGYASVRFDKFDGYADNIVYTHSEITQKKFTAEYTTDYSTWNAVDDLDRTTQTDTAVDPDKYVGVFYFMSHGAGESREGVLDSTKLYLEGGIEKIQSTFKSVAGSGSAYWAEPYFGYYKTADTWIFRKHANMFSAAGVDFIFLDLSNNVFYLEDVKLLFDTWLAMRAEGQTTPQICMMFGDMPYTTLNGLYTMYESIYCNEAYKPLLFQYDGKPLILGNNDRPGTGTWTSYMQSQDEYLALLAADPGVKDFYEKEFRGILREFTFRKCWAYKNATHKGYWDWLQYLPQAPGTNRSGEIECISVSMGIDSHRGLGRSLTDEHFFESGENGTYDTLGQYGFGLSTTAQGLFFQKQFANALKSEAKIMLITGWNEWSAGIQKSAATQHTGQALSSGWRLIDQFTPEYSRDGEPMKIRGGEDSVGFGDNYYYQMVSYIRQFKGVAEAPATVNGGAIDLSADNIDAQWEGVNPTFTDGVNDTAFRNEYSINMDQVYINNTARNDIAYAKVSQDAEALYFYVKTAGTMINVNDETWMNLYVDLDGDNSTGWEGYDIVVNRSRTANTASVESFVDGKWQFEKLGNAEMVLGENSITLKLSREMIGIGSDATALNFKWADNAAVDGDIMKFMELGDAAPDDRFYFTYTASGLENERPEIETESKTESESESAEVETPIIDESESVPTQSEADDTPIGLFIGLGCVVIVGGAAAGVLVCRRKKINEIS